MGQEFIYLMTCSTLTSPEDLNPLLRKAINLITPKGEVELEYAALKFSLLTGELGTPGVYLLLGLSPGSEYHMRLMDMRIPAHTRSHTPLPTLTLLTPQSKANNLSFISTPN